jgi:hypothetical protein
MSSVLVSAMLTASLLRVPTRHATSDNNLPSPRLEKLTPSPYQGSSQSQSPVAGSTKRASEQVELCSTSLLILPLRLRVDHSDEQDQALLTSCELHTKELVLGEQRVGVSKAALVDEW